MSIIFLILPITLFLCGGAVAAFAWATRTGQFDDLETPAIRLLHEDLPVSEREHQTVSQSSTPPH